MEFDMFCVSLSLNQRFIPLLHKDELLKLRWEVVVPCVSQRATLAVQSEELSPDLVLTVLH